MAKFKSDTINFHLDVKIGKDRLPLGVQHLEEFYIVQDLRKFLPSFKLRLRDAEGFLSHLVPFDKKANNVMVTLGAGAIADGISEYTFKIYRRFPTSDDIYDVEGLLDVDGLFSPVRTRGFSGSIQNTLSSIASELNLDAEEISASLDYSKNMVQPGWSNAEFLRYLENNLLGLQEDAGYFCYIYCKKRKKVLAFKSIKDLYSQAVKYNFINTFDPQQDNESGEVRYPILEYKAYDNYGVFPTGGRIQNYSHFDYNTSQFTVNSVRLKNNTISQDDFYSLTKYFLIDKDDPIDTEAGPFGGRGTDFSSTFKGRIKGKYCKELNDLSKLWITSLGLEDIYPGDIVRVQFLTDPALMMSYQYHGFWMVERVIHIIGHQFATRLLLTRSGMNTMEITSLLEAESGNIRIN